VSQYSIDSLPRFTGHDILVLNAAVRRFDDDPDRTTAAATDLDIDRAVVARSARAVSLLRPTGPWGVLPRASIRLKRRKVKADLTDGDVTGNSGIRLRPQFDRAMGLARSVARALWKERRTASCDRSLER